MKRLTKLPNRYNKAERILYTVSYCNSELQTKHFPNKNKRSDATIHIIRNRKLGVSIKTFIHNTRHSTDHNHLLSLT